MISDAKENDPVWIVEDRDVIPARVVRLYDAPPGPLEGRRVVVRRSDPAATCPLDTFAFLVFADSDWKAARAYADA